MSADQLDAEELVERYPRWEVDQDNRALFEGWLQRSFAINRCNDCGRWHHPPKPRCPACWSEAVTATPVAGTGTIFTLTVLHMGAPVPGVDYVRGYPVAVVDLDGTDGVRYTGGVVGADPETVTVGARVGIDWIDRDGSPMPVFRLAEVLGDEVLADEVPGDQ